MFGLGWKTVIFVIIIVISPYLYELYLSLTSRRTNRRRRYQQAEQRCRETGKPLLVIGDPDTGCINHYLGRDYGCGDLCLDLTGCPKCPITKSIKGPLEKELPRLKANSYVVFVSCTLEYVDDIETAVKELKRVSGGDLFIATVESYAPLHFLFRGSKRIITQAPPDTTELVTVPIPRQHYFLQQVYGAISQPFMKGSYRDN